jgi:hypothetical protein
MAPAVKTFPLHLRMPLVGNFLGGDNTWAIQWPGSEAIATIFLYVLPANPSSQVIYMIFLWLILAFVVGLIVYKFTHNNYISVLASLLILFDRNYFAIAHGQRPEFVATIVLLWLMFTFYRIIENPTKTKLLVQFYICCFFLPLVHAIFLPLAILTIVLSILFFVKGKWPLKTMYSSVTFLLLGICLLTYSFTHSYNAWLQFTDHLNQNADKIHIPITLFQSIHQFYYPFYTGGIVILIGILNSFYSIYNYIKKDIPLKNIKFIHILSLYILALSLIVGYHYNTYYAIFVFSLCLLSCAILLSKNWPRTIFNRNIVLLAIILFTGIHGLFWITREFKYIHSGKPDLRHELLDTFNTLPPSRRIYIPESLWEAAIYSNIYDRCLMNTLPYVTSNSRRQLYEKYAYQDVRNGDVLIVDRFSSNSSNYINNIKTHGWHWCSSFSHFLPGRNPWGYDLQVYVMDKNEQ